MLLRQFEAGSQSFALVCGSDHPRTPSRRGLKHGVDLRYSGGGILSGLHWGLFHQLETGSKINFIAENVMPKYWARFELTKHNAVWNFS